MFMVSIVIPVYNTSKYLPECLESIINQTYTDMEIICINDESTDNSWDVLKEYENKDSRIKAYSKKNEHNGGAASARNMGLDKATGKYVMFLDSDDFFDSEMVEKMVTKAEETDADVIICGAKDYDDKQKKIVGYNKKIETELAPKTDYFNYKDCAKYIFQIAEFIAWNKMFRLSIVRENNLFFEAIPISDDQYLPALALVHAKRIAIVDERFVNYRINTGSSQVDGQVKHPEAAYQATYSIVKRFRELGIYDEVKQSYINITLRLNRLYFDRMRSVETLRFLYDKYREEVWPMLDAMNLEEDYFYDSRLYQWYQMILTKSFEELLFEVARGYGAEMTTGILRFQVPFDEISKGAKIVLVGRGLIGKYWYAQLILSGYADVVAWVDSEAEISTEIQYDQLLKAR